MNFSARADTTFNLKDPARTSSLSAHSCRVLNFGTRRSNPRTRHVFTFPAQWLFPPSLLFSPFLFPFPSFPSPFLSLFLLFSPFSSFFFLFSLPLSLPLFSASLAITLLHFTSSHHCQSAPNNLNTLSQHPSLLSQSKVTQHTSNYCVCPSTKRSQKSPYCSHSSRTRASLLTCRVLHFRSETTTRNTAILASTALRPACGPPRMHTKSQSHASNMLPRCSRGALSQGNQAAHLWLMYLRKSRKLLQLSCTFPGTRILHENGQFVVLLGHITAPPFSVKLCQTDGRLTKHL